MGNVVAVHPREPDSRIVEIAHRLSRAHRRALARLLEGTLLVAHADVVQLVAELEIALLVQPAGPSRWKVTSDGRAVMSVFFAEARKALGPLPFARSDRTADAVLAELGLRDAKRDDLDTSCAARGATSHA